jgi:hypothetical protein
MAERMAAVEHKLSAMTFDGATNEVVITGANLRIVNGLGATDTTNGVGNLIVGYNELRPIDFPPPTFGGPPDVRTGSHNVVVGTRLNFSSFGGLVVGAASEISGRFSSVSGGAFNTASNDLSSVSGGIENTASGFFSSVSGGQGNTASGPSSSVSGGHENTARGRLSSVSGGESNTASGEVSSVSGGEQNTASGDFSSVSGGTNRTAPGTEDWAAGPLFADN